MLDLGDRLQIADQFTLIPIAGGQYVLKSLTTSLSLKGQVPGLMDRLFSLLNGERTVREVVSALAEFGEDSVHASLELLLDAGALDRADPDPRARARHQRFRGQTAFFSHFVAPLDARSALTPNGKLPVSSREFQDRLGQSRVAVFGIGRIGSQLVRALAVAGVGAITAIDSGAVDEADLAGDGWFAVEDLGRNRAEAIAPRCDHTAAFRALREPNDHAALVSLLGDCDVAVLCPDHSSPGVYDAFNRAALASGRTWTSGRFAGFEFHIGPTVIPGQTPCYECFRLRVLSNVADYDEYVMLENFCRENRMRDDSLAITPGAGLLTLEVLKALTWFAAPATCAHLYSLNLLTLQSELHPVLRIPRCPACGRPSAARPTVQAWQRSRVDPLP